jgi:glycosyltransferase involved in cell wall biosynthesis
LLRRAIDAMLDQEGDHLAEIVVVFDQSDPDATLENLSASIPIPVVANTNSPGFPGARNTGIEVARGDWIAFCDDDDVWLRDKLARQCEAVCRQIRKPSSPSAASSSHTGTRGFIARPAWQPWACEIYSAIE